MYFRNSVRANRKNVELHAYYTLSGEENLVTKILNPEPDKGVFCMTSLGCGTILSTYYIALKFSRATQWDETRI